MCFHFASLQPSATQGLSCKFGGQVCSVDRQYLFNGKKGDSKLRDEILSTGTSTKTRVKHEARETV